MNCVLKLLYRSVPASPCLNLILSLLLAPVCAYVARGQSSYVNFEGKQTGPIRLSPDGTRLFAVNPRNNDEVWVVNEVSDSISIVSVFLDQFTQPG